MTILENLNNQNKRAFLVEEQYEECDPRFEDCEEADEGIWGRKDVRGEDRPIKGVGGDRLEDQKKWLEKGIKSGNVRVDVRGETCPVPLVETRKALRRASPGDVIEVVGTHPASKKEIPMAVEALRLSLLSVDGTDADWTIRIQR